MRFFTPFGFLHRRWKSDNAATLNKNIFKINDKCQSLSFPLQAFDQWQGPCVVDTAVPTADLTASVHIPVSPTPSAHRIEPLQQDKAQLTSTVEDLTTRVAQLEGELMSACQDLDASLVREAYLKHQTREDEDEIVRLEEKVEKYTKFIKMMIDIGLDDKVLAQACSAIKAGQDADDALIDSIRKTATRLNSLWSKIVPAISGPRSPGEYVSALNTILKV